MTISEVTKRDIFEVFDKISWHGRLEETEFLARIYDLEMMPSTDKRFDNADADIWQHRINNSDWEDNWVFYDERFGIHNGEDHALLRFICETLHPVVRSNLQQVESLLKKFNELLAPDGYELFKQEEVSGRPIFAARQIEPFNPHKNTQRTKVLEFDHENPQPLLRALARLFASKGAATEVAILANSSASIGSKYNDFGEEYTVLYLQIPMYLYSQISTEITNYENKILEKVEVILRAIPSKDVWIQTVRISPDILEDPNWQAKAKAWLAGSNITNQGRVRSDNIASRTCDGLLFRSQPEIFLYQALKSLSVSFAPLPVFVRGGAEYRRIEPDFVIVKDGIIMLVEVDGDTVHQETPAEAHTRTTMLVHEGVHVERVRASECETLEKAKKCAINLMQVLKKIKSAK